MFHGFADLYPTQVALVAFSAFLLVSAAITCCFLVLLYGSQRADGNRLPPLPGAHPADMPQRMPLSGWIVGLLYLAGAILLLRFLLRCETNHGGSASPPGGSRGPILAAISHWSVLWFRVYRRIFPAGSFADEPAQRAASRSVCPANRLPIAGHKMAFVLSAISQ